MKTIIINILLLLLTVGCTVIKQGNDKKESVLFSVIQFNSIQDKCVKDSSVFNFVEVKSFLKLQEGQGELEKWVEYIEFLCAFRDNKKTSSFMSYDNYKSLSIIVKKKTAKVIFYESDISNNLTYWLSNYEEGWKVVDLKYSKRKVEKTRLDFPVPPR